jgi:signal transduction histidine kinase
LDSTQFPREFANSSIPPGSRRQQLLSLERDRTRIWWLSVAIILALSIGVIMFMLPEVLWEPGGSPYRRQVLFAGFCALTALAVVYLIRRQLSVASLTKKLISDVQLETLVQLNRELINKQLELDKAYARLAESQQNLVRLERLAAVGELSLKMQHEINNPLAAILGNLALLKQAPLPADVGSRVTVMEEMARRIQDAIERLNLDLPHIEIGKK